MKNWGPILEWADNGEGKEIMLLFADKAFFFVKQRASDVFTEAEITTLAKASQNAIGFAWAAHTKKHKTKLEAFNIACGYFAQKMLDLLMTIPLERRNAASDFVEADGFFTIVNGSDMD